MNQFDTAQSRTFLPARRARGQLFWLTSALVALAVLGGCGNKEKKVGQALASVNGEEITVLQLNEELQRSGAQAAQQEAARKQLLQALVDRQLLLNEAAKDKTDRDPKVVQSIERAKALIVAQAYMQKRIGTPARPTKAEIEAYYSSHPEFFAHRKQFFLRELILASKDLTDDTKAVIDRAKSLEEVALAFDERKIKFGRTEVVRTGAEMPSELSAKLLAMPKGQLFIVREGERSLLMSIADIKDAPVVLETAAPQIEQFLFNKKNKEAADAELARLRAAAKIEYFNKADQPSATPAAAPAPAPAAAAPAAAAPAAGAEAASDATARGVAGLK